MKKRDLVEQLNQWGDDEEVVIEVHNDPAEFIDDGDLLDIEDELAFMFGKITVRAVRPDEEEPESDVEPET
jgi:hypothetical protein